MKNYLSLWLLLLLIVTACKSPSTPISTPTTPPTTTSEPTTSPTLTPTESAAAVSTPAAVQIGPEGGIVTSNDTRARLTFPAGALLAAHTVTLETRERRPEDGAVLSPVIEITLSPAPQTPLDMPAVLTLLEPPVEAAHFQFARRVSLPGQTLSGEALTPLDYWLPLAQTRPGADGQMVLQLAQFSTFAPMTAPAPACAPTPADLTPPATPEGYVYLGVEVVINAVYRTEYSTAPLTRMGTPEDLLHITSRTSVQDAGIDCDLIIAHLFAPEVGGEPHLPPCQPDPQALTPPTPPAGFVYVGVEVTANNVWDERNSTVPPDRPDSPYDLRFIASSSVAQNQTLACDIIVSHLFEPAPTGTVSAECAPPEEVLQPPQPPAEGYVYVGRQVVVNRMYSLEHSTVPLGRAPAPDDSVSTSSSTTTRNGVVICDTIVNHVYARATATDAPQVCGPTTDELAPPPAPAGYVYVGRDVVINGVFDPERSTVPLERAESPQDLNIIRGHTQVQDAATHCDVIVRHLFAPISYSGCTAPPELLQMPQVPPCHRYVGMDVVINHQLVNSTIPLERPWQATDVVHISAASTVVNGQLICDTIVAHTFEPIPCPPCTTVVDTGVKPYVTTKPNGVYVSFSSLPAPAWEALADLSITPPISSTHGASVVFPPGTVIGFDGGETTVTLEPDFCK
jgi:hypothetical protein